MRYTYKIKQSIGSIWSNGRGKILLAVAFGWFLSISIRMIYPALLPYIRETYDLTLTTAGLLITVLWIAYAFGQLPGGILADWTGERPLLITSSVLTAMVLTLVILADSPIILFLATALFGVGTALYGVSRFTILEKIYTEQLGTATGVTMAAGDIGNAVMPPIAGFIAATIAWQYSFGFAIPLFLLAAVGLWVTLPRQQPTGTSPGESLSLDDIISALLQPAVRRGTILLVLWAMIIQAFMGFYPTYLADVKNLTAEVSTALFGLFFALGVLLKPIAGQIYDSSGVRVPLLVIMSAASLALGILPFVGNVWLFVPVTMLASSLLGFETIVITDLTSRLPEESQGANLGTLRTVYLALGALSPVLFGAIADRGYFDEAFLGLAGLAGIMVFLVCLSVDY